MKSSEVRGGRELIRRSFPYIDLILLACLCALLMNAATLAKPFIVKIVIDDFLSGEKAQSGIHSILAMGLLYLLATVAGSLLSFAQTNIINKAGQKIVKGLRGEVFATIQFLPLPYLDKTSSGRLVTRATNDIAEISDMYTDVFINLVKDIILIAGTVSAMVWMSWRLALVSLAVIPVMALLVVIIKNRIRRNFFFVKQIIGKINGFLAESIFGMKLIQIFRGEREKYREFEKLNDDYFDSTMVQVRLNSFLKPAADVFQSLAVAALIYYGMNRIAGLGLQIGVLFAFTTYIKQFFNPISDLAEKYTSIQSALVSADRIFGLLKEKDSLENLDAGLPVGKLAGKIEFKNVWFSYDGAQWALRDVSFVIESGQSAAFVGETGAGKSTIVNLINGFYTIQRGEILIDGMNIKKLRLKDLRRHIAVVLQDVFLFYGTMRDNIALNDDIDDATVNAALRISCADSLIASFHKGLDEPVLERGNTLSAGQRQLVAFARAIAHSPSIFIFDEATAHIDTHTEKLIQKAIDNIARERTTIIVAHRLSTIRHADRIFAMEGGRIVESGTHDKLMKNGGYYASLVNSRSGKKAFRAEFPSHA